MEIRRTLGYTGLAAILSACSGNSDNTIERQERAPVYNIQTGRSGLDYGRKLPIVQEGPYKGFAYEIMEDPDKPGEKNLSIYGPKGEIVSVIVRKQTGNDEVRKRTGIEYHADAVRQLAYPDRK